MLDENIWLQLKDEEKIAEIKNYLSSYLSIESGEHELYFQSDQGKLPNIKKELESKIFKILEIENAS
jgi:hypothetical protein